MSTDEPLVQVAIFNHEGQHLQNARVVLEWLDQNATEKHDLSLDQPCSCYVAQSVVPGRYRLSADAPNYASDHRIVQVQATGLRTIMILGCVNFPFLYRGGVKTPFEPHPDVLALAFDPAKEPEAVDEILDIANKWNLTLDDLTQQVRHHHIYVYRFAPNTDGTARNQVIELLLGINGVKAGGPPVHISNDNVSFLTNELIVKFHADVDPEQAPQIAGLKRLRKLEVADNVFLFRIPGPVTYEMLNIAAALVDSGLVEYAEPNLISTVVNDGSSSTAAGNAIHPSDFLFAMQWHLPLIGCPQAWGFIRREVSVDHAMGSPDITIAVVDWGIDIRNPDFAGEVSNGTPKVYQVFDFHNMASNNHWRTHGHGTCCAGVATARPNNDGVCGVAGNCRLMAIRRPEGHMGYETGYSDMYLWIAGFDPASTTSGFPERISPGADVISNSFGQGAGLPISGLMRDTFDFLTTHGRAGRGTLLFFSTGNNDQPRDFTLERPWAAYERTFAVTASTLANGGISETNAEDSNFGGVGVVDFCAPSASKRGAEYNPPATYAVVTAADRCSSDTDHNLQPNAPSRCAVQGAVSADVNAGGKVLPVISRVGFPIGQCIVIGTPGSKGTEFNRITGSPDDTTVELEKELNNQHPSGTPVFGGPTYSLHSFSGTSCATALAAGVGALLLSARPNLTWEQARAILRGTAVRIDEHSTDPIGAWRDLNGARYSARYGFGRIDAFAAIEAALRSS